MGKRSSDKYIPPYASKARYVYHGKNPLIILKEGGTIEPLKITQIQAMTRLLGSDRIRDPFKTMFNINEKVFTGHFNRKINKILKEHQPPSITLPRTQGNTRTTGSLTVKWREIEGVSTTNHHIIARSLGGKDIEANYYPLPRNVHDDFHTVFGVFTPIEQLALLALLFKEMMHPTFFIDISDILLGSEQKEFYEPGIVAKGRIRY